jgi:5-methylcytosine-specific restriction endonuclease McrA
METVLSMHNPKNPKERNLIKGALRRVFSRSELRLAALKSNVIEHADVNRPRVTKWAWCNACGEILPAYTMQVDHLEPVIKVEETLEDLTWDELIDRLWCAAENLSVVCKDCHKSKTKLENKERRLFRKGKR